MYKYLFIQYYNFIEILNIGRYSYFYLFMNDTEKVFLLNCIK